MATSSEIGSQMLALVRVHFDSLQQRSFAELSAIPEVETEKVSVLSKSVKLTTYRRTRGVDHMLIVVQAFRETLLGAAAQISVRGFVVSSSGEKTDAAEEMLWDYS